MKMRAKIVNSGGSRTVRIPKAMWEQSKLPDDVVDVAVNPGRIVISSGKTPRQGWDEAFERMAAEKDDAPVDGALADQSRWDQTEWQW
jgi:antitoxin MazE